MNNQLSTYRALYNMALQNDHTEAIEFFRARIMEELQLLIDRAKKRLYIMERIAKNRDRIQHHAVLTAAGFTLKNGRYYAK